MHAPQSNQSTKFPRWTLAVVAGALVTAAFLGGAIYWRGRLPALRFQRALAAIDAKLFEEVKRELDSLEGAAGFEPHRHFLRGVLLVQAGNFYPALDEFGHSVNHPELRVRTLTWSGQALYQLGRFQDAIGLLVQAVKEDPEAVDAHRWLSSAYYDLGLTDNAMVHLVRLAALDPTDPRPHRLMGLIQKDFENYQAAVESYRESLRREARQPDREEILMELAESQLKLRQGQAALETLALCQPSADRWAAEAECHYTAGRLDEADRLLDQALEQSPAHLAALLLKGTIAMDTGKTGEAVAVLARAAVAYPKDYTAQFKLARALRRVGEDKRADEHARAADQIKRLREEFSRLHATAAAAPNDAEVRCKLGVLARQLDRPDLARVWFRAALAIDPRHEEARRNLLGVPPPASAPPSPRGEPQPAPRLDNGAARL